MADIQARPSTDEANTMKPPEMSASNEELRTSPGAAPETSSGQRSPPALMNKNRPPSATSTQSSVSNGSGVPRSTTATSRRGGRIRSRSPLSMSYGSAPAPNESPDNPSSAAAAAAAAAKALSNSAGTRNQQGWFDQDRRPDNSNKYYPGSQSWPGEGGQGYGPQAGRQPHPQNRSMPQADGYAPPAAGSFSHQMPYDSSPSYGYDGMNRYGSYEDGSVPPGTFAADPAQRGRRQPGHDYYKGQGGGDPFMNPSGSGPGTPAASNRGGTSRVIGTPTPIHVPRASEPSAPGYSGNTASSVFRGRPGKGLPTGSSATDEDSPQKILLSLSKSRSFEEKDGAKMSKDPKAPLSPADPPQIQHSHNQTSVDIFEPQKGSKQGGNIDMAGSFSLFNQSFDSLGEAAQYLTGDPFQSHSFGVAPTGSGEHESAGLLPNAMSMSGSHFLGTTSSGGALTFGMSPVNSFGIGAPTGQPRIGGNMMVLGGADGRSASPTQVLGMYPSYSSGYPNAQMPFRQRSGHMGGEDHIRNLSSASASFGGATMSQAYTRSFEHSPHGAYGGPMIPGPTQSVELPNGPLMFYAFLKRNKGAFIRSNFLLPGLKAALLEAPTSDPNAKMNARRGYGEPTPQDTAIAQRRFISAVCAFGGGTSGDRVTTSTGNTEGGSLSIFRERDDDGTQDTATVTPSSSTGTPPGSRFESRARIKYDEMLSTRYYENENRLSWEFEESPPVDISRDESSKAKKKPEQKEIKTDDGDEYDEYVKDFMAPMPENTTSDQDDSSKPSGSGEKEKKMRYRCKLCGKPKQNHVCPYQKSLQRSIGAMVYPAVNAYTAHEPGLLAPTLTDMNNFVASGTESISSGDHSPARKSPGRNRRGKQTDTSPPGKAPNVTPDARAKAKTAVLSPESAKSLSPDTEQKVLQTPKRVPKGSKSTASTKSSSSSSHPRTPQSTAGRKRLHSQLASGGSDDQDLLFVDAVELKPEQFRTVTMSKKPLRPDAYTYPALPLPYAQRKRLSDNLFSLSKEVPKLTDECAAVLREAREKDMWDLAVAELMTQVVIVIHCSEGDTRFDGLHQYLLTLGIAC